MLYHDEIWRTHLMRCYESYRVNAVGKHSGTLYITFLCTIRLQKIYRAYVQSYTYLDIEWKLPNSTRGTNKSIVFSVTNSHPCSSPFVGLSGSLALMTESYKSLQIVSSGWIVVAWTLKSVAKWVCSDSKNPLFRFFLFMSMSFLLQWLVMYWSEIYKFLPALPMTLNI